MKKVDKVWAYLSIENDVEGVCAFFSKATGGWMPMVATTKKTMEMMGDVAQDLADTSGAQIKLAEFTVRTDIKIIEPE